MVPTLPPPAFNPARKLRPGPGLLHLLDPLWSGPDERASFNVQLRAHHITVLSKGVFDRLPLGAADFPNAGKPEVHDGRVGGDSTEPKVVFVHRRLRHAVVRLNIHVVQAGTLPIPAALDPDRRNLAFP